MNRFHTRLDPMTGEQVADDPITQLMNDLRNRGRARLIHGHLGESLEVEEVTAEILHQPNLWNDGPPSEELVVTLDTLETILRWGRRG